MSSSTVTYMLVYSNYELWRFQRVSDDEPEAPKEASRFLEQAPPSPDYVPRPEHPPSLEYVPIDDQPLPVDASPTALSPSYVADFDPSEDDSKKDPDEDPVDVGDDDDDEDDHDYDNDDDDDEDEEEEHLASADSTTLPVVDLVPSAEDTEAFKTNESAPTPTHTSLTYVEASLDESSNNAAARKAELLMSREVQTHETHIQIQNARIRSLETLVMTLMAQTLSLQTQMTAALGRIHTLKNLHVKTVGHDVAYGMPWKTLKKMMTDKYYPRGEIKKPEIKLWNLKVKGFNKVKKYVGGLPDVIQGSVMGHYKKDCQKLKNNNHENQAGNDRATTRAYAVGNARKNPDANVVTGTFLLNNRYASILSDTGADRSFVFTTFSYLIDIVPTALDHDNDVELADGKIIRVNTIIRGCTLNFLNHTFNIDLMPVKLGSFEVIIGMD
nr:reverse transcriptase domain-containing protein [Tanacetum cinerariifolium]